MRNVMRSEYAVIAECGSAMADRGGSIRRNRQSDSIIFGHDVPDFLR